jgi:hypothetical protein
MPRVFSTCWPFGDSLLEARELLALTEKFNLRALTVKINELNLFKFPRKIKKNIIPQIFNV